MGCIWWCLQACLVAAPPFTPGALISIISKRFYYSGRGGFSIVADWTGTKLFIVKMANIFYSESACKKVMEEQRTLFVLFKKNSPLKLTHLSDWQIVACLMSGIPQRADFNTFFAAYHYISYMEFPEIEANSLFDGFNGHRSIFQVRKEGRMLVMIRKWFVVVVAFVVLFMGDMILLLHISVIVISLPQALVFPLSKAYLGLQRKPL